MNNKNDSPPTNARSIETLRRLLEWYGSQEVEIRADLDAGRKGQDWELEWVRYKNEADALLAGIAALEQPDEPPAMHVQNELADMATNGIQWLRNIAHLLLVPETSSKDVDQMVVRALREMESNWVRIVALRDGQPPAQQGGNADGVMPEHDMERAPETARWTKGQRVVHCEQPWQGTVVTTYPTGMVSVQWDKGTRGLVHPDRLREQPPTKAGSGCVHCDRGNVPDPDGSHAIKGGLLVSCTAPNGEEKPTNEQSKIKGCHTEGNNHG